MSKFPQIEVQLVVKRIARGINPDYAESGIPIINQKCVRPLNKIDMQFCKYQKDDDSPLEKTLQVEKGDIFVNPLGDGTLGRAAHVDFEVSETLTWDRNLALITPDHEKVCSRFLGWSIHSKEEELVSCRLGGTNQLMLPTRAILHLKVPFPPLETQQRIADYLDKETGEIDEMIENLEGLVEELKNRNVESANSVLEREEFPRKKLWQLVDFVSESDEDSNYISLDMMESWTGRLLTNDIEHSDQYIGTRFQPGDILFGKLRPYLAKSWLADREGVVVGDIHVYRPKPGISGLYLEQLFRTNTFVSFADSSSNGVKMPRVEWTRLSQYKFPAPSESVQTEIALELKDRTLEVQEMISQCSGLIEDLKARRSALITEVVSGRKEV